MDRDADLIRTRRVQYETAGLDVGDLDPDPFEQWLRWHAEAHAAGISEPNAMVLATATRDGEPSSRAVLVRGADARGFVFFTNYASPKSVDLESNGRAAGLFPWFDLHRQVRVRGTVSRISDDESDAYFATRPRGSQTGAWASPQGQVIASRDELDRRVAEVEARFAHTETIPRPPFWGGWRLAPHEFEFWQGRPNRLHDRLCYRRADAGDAWVIERLAP